VSYTLTGLTPNTTYHFRVKGVNTGGTTNGLDQSFSTTAASATVTTQAVSSITSVTAIGNGNITSLGVPNPTSYGVCWNTTAIPTIDNSKVDKGAASATGAFTASMTSLTANTTYFVRAFATNSAGTSYGMEVQFTTVKGDPPIVITGSTAFSYTGLKQGPATAILNGPTGEITYSYSGTGSTLYTASATPPTNAGTYQVIAHVAVTTLIANFAATSLTPDEVVSEPFAFTIDKVELTISAGNQTIPFGAPASTVTSAGTYTPTGFVNNESSRLQRLRQV
jgi:hypothetical protein